MGIVRLIPGGEEDKGEEIKPGLCETREEAETFVGWEDEKELEEDAETEVDWVGTWEENKEEDTEGVVHQKNVFIADLEDRRGGDEETVEAKGK